MSCDWSVGANGVRSVDRCDPSPDGCARANTATSANEPAGANIEPTMSWGARSHTAVSPVWLD